MEAWQKVCCLPCLALPRFALNKITYLYESRISFLIILRAPISEARIFPIEVNSIELVLAQEPDR